MLNDDYVIMGLDGLSRAYQHDYFRDGHLGASVIAAYYLCNENDLDDRTQDAVKAHIDRELRDDPLFLPTPKEEPDVSRIEHLLTALSLGASDLREVGHNVIFAAAALKAFQSVPQAVTPFRVEGISKLIAAFTTTQNVAVDASDQIPESPAETPLIDFIFREYLRSVVQYAGYGQGWAGHLLTFGHAVIELSRLGYPKLGSRAYQAYRMYIKTMRRGPKEADRRILEHSPSSLTPLDYGYWEQRKSVRSGIGHAFKYPYSFYNLLAKLDDSELRQRCLAESYRIL